jgi:hypothetical protein
MFYNKIINILFVCIYFILLYYYYEPHSKKYIILSFLFTLNTTQIITFSVLLYQNSKQIVHFFPFLFWINFIFFVTNVVFEYVFPQFLMYDFIQLLMNFYNIVHYSEFYKKMDTELQLLNESDQNSKYSI